MRVSVQVQLFEVVTSCYTWQESLTLTRSPYSFHSEGYIRKALSFRMCNKSVCDDGMMIEGKSFSWEPLQKPLDPHAKYCSLDSVARWRCK